MPPKMNREGNKSSKYKNKWGEKFSEDYYLKRQRNNDAVRKSREKSRQRAKEVQSKVQVLKQENNNLESKMETLSKELSVLQDLFMMHADGVEGGASLCKAEAPSSPVNEEALNKDHKYCT